MRTFVLALAATAALTSPGSAQSLSTLLPLISFPDPVVTPSTKGCGMIETKVCVREE